MKSVNAKLISVGFSEDAASVFWSAEGLPLKQYKSPDFWRMYLEDSDFIGRPVGSSGQTGEIREVPGGTDIHYQSIRGENGKTYQIEMTVHVRAEEEKLCFWATISSKDSVRINEIKLPFVDLEVIGSIDREKDYFYRPMGFGERIANPWQAVEMGHSDYMYDEQKEVWLPLTYPSFSSMAWQGIESAGHFLYMGRHDELFRSCVLAAGKGPRGSDPRLMLTVSHFPLLQEGETEETAKTVVAVVSGDWRRGADIYRSWAQNSWWGIPERPKWVQEFTGWQRIILKHQYGEILYRYEDLVWLYEEGKKAGLDTLFVFGWWKGRFDNSYPVYEPDPALGGEEELKKAIAKVQQLGGRVILYTNGVLIDVQSEYYKEKGAAVCRKDIDGNEYREHYRFSNEAMLLRSYGYKSFVSACQATDEWKQQLFDQGKIMLLFDPDSIFYDQLGGHFPLICFDSSHKHGNRGDREAIWRRENLKDIRSLCKGEQAIGTEFVVDCVAPFVDYVHSVCGGKKRSYEFPEMFRYTFPELILTNREVFDDATDYKRQLNFAFVYGMRYCVSVYRCRSGIHAVPGYAEHLKKLLELKKEYSEFFYYGRFALEVDLELPSGVIKTEYESDSGRLFVFWNDSDSSKEFTFNNEKIELMPDDIKCEVYKNV